LENATDPERRGGAEDDVRQRAVRRHDHRPADRNDLGRRRAVPAVARVQGAREGAGRVVADDDPRLDSTLLERLGLQLRVLVDGPPEGPGERHDDADLHPVGVYERATKARALRAGRALAVSV